MNENLELIYWSEEGGTRLPLEDWQYSVILQVLGLSIQEDENGVILNYFAKDFVMERINKMGLFQAKEI